MSDLQYTRQRRSSRPKRILRWCRLHRKTSVAALLVLFCLAVNVVAYLHAGAMLHYVPGGTKTRRPEQLSLFGKAQVLLCGVTVPRPVNDRTPEDIEEVESIEERIAASDGIALEAWHIKHPKPQGMAVLLHGYASCKSRLLDKAIVFRQLGYESLLLDFRGSGGSSGNETSLGIHEARDVEAALKKARELSEGRTVLLYGQSMGAVAILRAMALEDARPDAVILEAPFDRLINTVANRFRLIGLPSFPLAHLLVYWGGVRVGFSGFRHNPVEYAGMVDCPTLVLHGARDRRVTQDECFAVFEAINGNKEFKLFPAADHHLGCFDADPKMWKETVGRFVSKLPKPSLPADSDSM